MRKGQKVSDTFGFYIAAFAFDGEQAGESFWEFSEFQSNALDTYTAYLNNHGAVFDAYWGVEPGSLRTKFTSASGAAIATNYCRDQLVSSFLLLSGQSPSAELTLVKMFIDSVARTSVSLQAAASPTPFTSIAKNKNRPLFVVVTWPTSDVSETEQASVRNIGLHLGAAFIRSSIQSP